MGTLATGFLVLVSLTQAAPTPEELVKQLKEPDARVRRLAAEALGKQKVTNAAEALSALLGDEQEAVRAAVADALLQLGEKAVAPVAAQLQNESETARLSAV